MSRRHSHVRSRRLVPAALEVRGPALTQVLALGRDGENRRAGIALACALVGVLLLMWFAAQPADAPPEPPPVARTMEAALVELPPPPPPEPIIELPPEPPPPATRPEPTEPPPPPTQASAEEAPIPTEAAEAGQVVEVASDEPAMSPEDFRMAVGAGLAYVGGLTTSSGTAKAPVKGGGDGTGTGPGQLDRSRGAWPERADWDCGAWPVSGDDFERVASIRAHIDAKGNPVWVEVVKAPSPEIARWAQSCAMRERFFPARDSEGRSIAQTIGPLRVRFLRQ